MRRILALIGWGIVTLCSGNANAAPESSLDFQVDGLTCSGKIYVPAGTTFVLAVHSEGETTDRVLLHETVSKGGPINLVPYSFRFSYRKEPNKNHPGAYFLCSDHSYFISYPERNLTLGSGESALAKWPTLNPENVELEIKCSLGRHPLQHNKIYDLASWSCPETKETLKVLVSDFPDGQNLFHPDPTSATPDTLGWQKTSNQNDIADILHPKELRDPDLSSPLVLASVPYDLNYGSVSNYYQIKALSSQAIKIQLVADDPITPIQVLKLNLIHGRGTLTPRLTLEDQTLHYSIDLETGGEHHVLNYFKTYPQVPQYQFCQMSGGSSVDLPMQFKGEAQPIRLVDLDMLAPYFVPLTSPFRFSIKPGFPWPAHSSKFYINDQEYKNPAYPMMRLQVGLAD